MGATGTAMRLRGFEVEHVEELRLLQATAHTLRHGTGACLIHIAIADEDNRLSSVIPTWVHDDTGWSHVLEHCVLHSRSRHYGRADLMRGRRWLATGGGAWTAPDYTHYGLGCPDLQGFCELIDLRCDQLFEPELDDEVFRNQINLEFEGGDPAQRLIGSGIIYNEQKSIAGLDLMVAWDDLMRGLFPSSQYAHHSGGRFLEMTGLTPERLRAEHARHYQPSRALFVSWGPAELEAVAAAFDAALTRVPPPVGELAAPPPPVDIASPGTRRVELPASPSTDVQAARQVLVAWATVDWSDPYEVFLHDVAWDALARNPDSPIRPALAKAGYAGGAVDTVYEHGWRPRRHIFSVGVRGAGAAEADGIQEVVLSTLAELARSGLEVDLVAGSLRRLEAGRRFVGGESPGVFLVKSVVPAWLFGSDPLAALRFDELQARFRQEDRPLERFIERYLLENPRRVTLAVEPDPGGIERLLQMERDRLDGVRAALDEAGRAEFLDRAAKVRRRQQQDEAEVKDAAPPATDGLDSTVPDLEPIELTAAGVPVEARLAATRGASYLDLHANLAELPDGLVPLLNLFAALLRSSPGVPGGLGAAVDTIVDASRDRFTPVLRLSAIALPSELEGAARGVVAALSAITFEPDGLRRAISAAGAAAEEAIFRKATANVGRLAASQVRASAAYQDRVQGFAQLDFLREVAEASDSRLASVARDLEEIRAHLARRSVLGAGVAVSRREDADVITAALDAELSKLPAGDSGLGSLEDRTPGGGALGRSWSQAGFFNASAYRLPGLDHPDAAALEVACHYATGDHVRREVATRGTAYGAWALPDLEAGLANLGSMRDPNLKRTFDAFDEAIRRIRDGALDPVTLQRARIDAWKHTELGLNPAARARRAYADVRRCLLPGARTRFRAATLVVTDHEVKAAAASLGEPGRASMGSADALRGSGLFARVD